MKRSITIAATAVLLSTAVILSGCSADGGGGEPVNPDREAGDLTGLRLAFAIPTSGGEVFVNQAEMFKAQAEELGATVDIYDNNGDAVTMLSNADLMVASQPDVIVEYAPVADATDRVGDKFADAGIPCIALNVPVKGCALFNFDQPYLAALGAEAMAAQMADRGWDASNTTVIIGQASELGESVNIAVTSFYAELSTLVPGMTPVKSSDITPTTTVINEQGLQADLGLTPDSGYEGVLAALQTVPADRNVIVYTVSDDTTVGVIRALESLGRSDAAMVSGYGGGLEALTAVRDGSIWTTEQMGFFAYWGQFALAMVAAIEQGATIPELTSPPMVVLTKDNVDQFFTPGTDELLVMPELPESSRYLIETGILQHYDNVEGARG